MRKQTLHLLGIIIIATLSFAACKKTGTTTTAVKLVGTWHWDHLDFLYNGVISPTPISTWYYTSGTLIFNADKTGSNTLVFYTDSLGGTIDTAIDNFTWSAAADSIAIVSGSRGAYGFHIDTLTSTLLVLQDTGIGSNQWSLAYTK